MAWRFFFPVVGGYLMGQLFAGELFIGRFVEPLVGSVLGGVIGMLIFRWLVR